jgi:4-diphosphocytidyl-2C-methyl-D-erythritol kinase
MTLQAESTAALRDALRGENDLFAAACVVQPKIKALARELSEIVTRIAPEAHVQMTGSGSTLIVGGVDRSHRAAITAACGQNAACRGCVVVPTKTCA